ncbi:Hypothetical protein PHPALM_19750 [Phytophthora palmivora]|uniref:Uncharacterized protein n=1 Tax=Phytophthora palmivora TaxID=4796 RepID=A0A2P4XGM4_9STRA|nr:Hypothetical protein PHPALM_19750 [Phytophthora palmivora]
MVFKKTLRSFRRRLVRINASTTSAIVWCTRSVQALTFRVPVLDVEAVDPERGWNLGITVKRELYVHNHQIYRHYPGISHVSTQAQLFPGITTKYQYICENSNHQVNMTDVLTDERVVSASKCTWGYGIISGSMRAMLGGFPVVIQMDCMYNSNSLDKVNQCSNQFSKLPRMDI